MAQNKHADQLINKRLGRADAREIQHNLSPCLSKGYFKFFANRGRSHAGTHHMAVCVLI